MPRIEVCVKMNDRDRSVDPVQRAENGEDNRVVTAKTSAAVSNGPKEVQGGDVRDNLWVLLVVLREWTRRADHALRIGEGNVTMQEGRICDFHLIDRQGIVEWADWDLGGHAYKQVTYGKHLGTREEENNGNS
jgi:hypothetical protein